MAEQLLDDPAAVQARVAAMLGAYWEQSFAEEWTRLEPILAAEVERAKGVDPIVLLGAVRSELRVDPEQRLLVRQSFHACSTSDDRSHGKKSTPAWISGIA